MLLNGMRVGVTGASGFLGSHVVDALKLSKAEPVAVVRSPDRAAFLGVEVRQADLLDEEALKRAFDGLDAVVHCAALYTLRLAPWDDFYRANVTGTEHLMSALGAAGVGRAVYVSTWGVYRFRPGTRSGGRLHEDSPQVHGERKEGGGYRASKQLGEARAWELAGAQGVELTVLRPGGIYGARDRVLLPKLRLLARLPLSPAPSLLAPLVHAGDVASAAVSALREPVAKGRAYNAGGPDSSFTEFMRALHRADPRARGFTLPIPAPFALTLDNTRAARELGFSNRSYEAGLFATFAEMETAG